MCTFTTNIWAEIFHDEYFVQGKFAVDGPAKNCRQWERKALLIEKQSKKCI
jgi:hypothetical protein